MNVENLNKLKKDLNTLREDLRNCHCNYFTEAMSSIIFTMHFRVKPKYLGHVEDKNMDLMYELAEKASPMRPIHVHADKMLFIL